MGSDCFVLGNTIQTPERPGRPVVKDNKVQSANKRSQGTTNVLSNIDCVPSNVQFLHQEALLFVCEDNEAVIQMIIKGRSPTMRHVSRPTELRLIGHSIESTWTPRSKSNTLTPNQLADILTTGNFTLDEWNHLLCLFNISHFSSTECSEVM